MRVLVACEESQAVCIAFRERGHEAYSCDIQPCSGGHPEWHIQDDALVQICYPWDLVIAHPPCTYLSRVAVQHNKKPGRLPLREDAINFFLAIKNSTHIPMMCIENPVPQKYVREKIGFWTQTIQPWYFGDDAVKTTCLWLRGLPKLYGNPDFKKPAPAGYNKRGNPYYFSDRVSGSWQNKAKQRSKTFPGIARAMAAQWGAIDNTITPTQK